MPVNTRQHQARIEAGSHRRRFFRSFKRDFERRSATTAYRRSRKRVDCRTDRQETDSPARLRWTDRKYTSIALLLLLVPRNCGNFQCRSYGKPIAWREIAPYRIVKRGLPSEARVSHDFSLTPSAIPVVVNFISIRPLFFDHKVRQIVASRSFGELSSWSALCNTQSQQDSYVY